MDAFSIFPSPGEPGYGRRGGTILKIRKKIQEGVIETDNAAAAFRDGGQHIIDDDFFRGPVKKRKALINP